MTWLCCIENCIVMRFVVIKLDCITEKGSQRSKQLTLGLQGE